MSIFTFDNFVLSQVKCNDAKDTANLSSKSRKLEMGGVIGKIWVLCLLLLTTWSDCWLGEHGDAIQVMCKWKWNTKEI